MKILDIDKIDIEILFHLYNEKALTPLSSMQIKSIVKHFEESSPISYTTAVRRMQSLITKEYIQEGYKLKRAKTYFLSLKGKDFIEINIINAEEAYMNIDDVEENNNEMEE